MNNKILLWNRHGPTPLRYFPHMNQDVRRLQDQLLFGISRYLDENNIIDYKLIFVEIPDHNILTNLHLFAEKNIIILQSDHLHHADLQFADKDLLISNTVSDLVSAANYYRDKNILFYSLTTNLNRELEQIVLPSNLIIKWGDSGNLLYSLRLYNDCPLVLDKDLDSDKLYINLNNRHRLHRPIVVSYLLGKNLGDFGIISLRNQSVNESVECFSSWTTADQQQILEIVKSGAELIKDTPTLDLPQLGNVANNYNRVLSPLYKKTFVEIVSDTTFYESAGFINDKYINSIFGANFPIFVASVGTVKTLRNFGFDMFDDIIDHSYDEVVNPVLRLSKAIDLNQHLLSNSVLTKTLWSKNANRFIDNCNFLNSNFITIADQILNQTWSAGAAELKLK